MTKPLTRVAVAYGDTHIPFQDDACLRVVAKIIKSLQPDLILNLGDLLDAHQMSMKFNVDPLWKDSLQDNIDQAVRHLDDFAALAPDARKVLLLGNHEERLERLLKTWTGPNAEVIRLRQFQNHITWNGLFSEAGLEGWEVYPYGNQLDLEIIPNLITKHGNKVSQHSGYTAAAELRHHGRSGISGHVHRLGLHYKSDAGGNHVWCESGCTCTVRPHYTENPNWQHGCVVIEYNASWFNMTPVFIQDGFAMFRGKEFRA